MIIEFKPNNNILHFFTDNKYISYLQYRSIYSFWAINKDWTIKLYCSLHPTSKWKKRNNYFNSVLELIGRLYTIDFKKIGFRNTALPKNKAEYLKTYVDKTDTGYWFNAKRFYTEPGYDVDKAFLYDNTLPIVKKGKYPMDTLTGQYLSLLDTTYILDMLNYKCETGAILDIGCGDKTIEDQLINRNITSVDAWDKYNPSLVWDLNYTPLPYNDNSFDHAIALDLIEHLSKEKGEALLLDLKRIVKKGIIILTPLWWTLNTENVDNPDSPYYQNQYDLHKSLWTLDDFKDWDRFLDKGFISKYYFGIWHKK